MSDPLVKVVKTESFTNKYCRPGEGTLHFTLVCGHAVFAKKSAGYHKKKRCRDCGMKKRQ